MKVTLIGPVFPYRGGIAHYTSHLAKKLVAVGHDTQVISFKRQYPSWLYPGSTDKDPSAEPLSVNAEFLMDPIYPWTWLQTVKKISQFEPRIVAIQWWTTFWSPAYAILSQMLKKEKMQIVYVIHNVLPHEEKIWDPYLAQLALSSGKGFIIHTDHEKERLQKLLPESNSKICPFPVYDSFAQSRMSKSNARKLLGLPEKTPILLAFGIVRPYKGLHVLLNALELLLKRGENFYLLIAGEFWDDKKYYIDQIDRLDLNKCVRIEDRYLPDEEVARIFSAVDVLIAPYTGGTQSAVASWGQGFGIPMIVSEKVAAGINELDPNLITVTPSGDHVLLAKAIENFIGDIKNQHDLPQTPNNANDSWNNLIQALVSFATQI